MEIILHLPACRHGMNRDNCALASNFVAFCSKGKTKFYFFYSKLLVKVKTNFHITWILTLRAYEWSHSHLGTFSSSTLWLQTSRAPCRAGHLQPTGRSHESFRTRLRATVVYAHTKTGGRGIELNRKPLFTNSKLHKGVRSSVVVKALGY